MNRLGSNVTVDQIKDLDRLGLISRNLVDAPIKDTVSVPDGGYTIVRFVADNPGKIPLATVSQRQKKNNFIEFCFRLLEKVSFYHYLNGRSFLTGASIPK